MHHQIREKFHGAGFSGAHVPTCLREALLSQQIQLQHACGLPSPPPLVIVSPPPPVIKGTPAATRLAG